MAPRSEEHGTRGHVAMWPCDQPSCISFSFWGVQLENESLSVFFPYDLHGVALQVGPMIPRQNFAPTFQQALSLFEIYSNPDTLNILLWPFPFPLAI